MLSLYQILRTVQHEICVTVTVQVPCNESVQHDVTHITQNVTHNTLHLREQQTLNIQHICVTVQRKYKEHNTYVLQK